MTNQHVYDEACSNFLKIFKKEWKWNTCYILLKDTTKFKKLTTKNDLTPRVSRHKKHSSDGEPKGPDSTSISSVNADVVVERPVGKKELKDRRRKEKEGVRSNLANSHEAINKLASQLEIRATKRDDIEFKKLEQKREIELRKLQIKHDFL
ncbi:hypothetical protein AQUCO_03000302v1 [Aquilegia coerulea]|uniref:No apical meristem-associated C-terminal domain-containing protein n=1 Tax=Aquilegia coerulea TaxID=218851 RepID=A0A2G5D2C8_AQUCA|nr:hypothetical protein AQUCO_03000302v1 [Aquilegia coerulea]